MTARIAAVCALVVGVLAGCGGARQAPVTAVAPAGSTELRPGDIVRLKIWREPDLSGDFAVDDRSIVTLPKIGPYEVKNVPADSLQARLVNSYKEFLQNPSIEVTPLRRFAVSGAVKNPGLYPTDPTMTLGDAVALAGGASTDGKHNQIQIRRDGLEVRTGVPQSARLTDLKLRSGDMIYVPQRSWVSRNPWFFTSLLATATTAVVILTR